MKKIFLSLILSIFIITIFGNIVLAAETDTENETEATEEAESNDELGASTDTSSEYYTLTEDDFSNAKYEISYSMGSATLTISGIKNLNSKSGAYLRMAVTSSTNEEPVYDDSTSNVTVDYDKGILKYSYFAKYVELNKDLYINLFYADYTHTVIKKLVSAKKVERPAYPKYSNAFSDNTLASYMDAQLILDAIPMWTSGRKGKIKIGKISDYNILNNIKNNKIEGWEGLLNYSKTDSSPVYNVTQESSKASSWIQFNNKINLTTSQLSDKDYYYLYIEMDNENGKYYPIEAVTLTQANVYQSQNAWFMFFVGSSKFNWDNISSGQTTPQPSTPTPTTPTQNPPTQTTDPTVAPTSLPRTGADVAIVVSIVGFTAAGMIAFIKSKKYRGIK